jgi:hypothetical protein
MSLVFDNHIQFDINNILIKHILSSIFNPTCVEHDKI